MAPRQSKAPCAVCTTVLESARLSRVVIDDLWQGTYYAKLHVERERAPALEIDCRPSDAIALALRFRAPILVAEHVLVEASESE